MLTRVSKLFPGPVQNRHFLNFGTTFGRFGDSISELFHVQIWGPMPSGFNQGGGGGRHETAGGRSLWRLIYEGNPYMSPGWQPRDTGSAKALSFQLWGEALAICTIDKGGYIYLYFFQGPSSKSTSRSHMDKILWRLCYIFYENLDLNLGPGPGPAPK